MCPGLKVDARLPLEGQRILVVEDEALVAMLLEDELVDAGAQVIGPAVTVRDALRLVEAAAADGGIDAAVLDIKLEGGTAVPLVDQLAACGVPFVFATGCGKDCDTGGHCGMPVLHKPFEGHQLVDAVASLAVLRKSLRPKCGGRG